MSFLSSDPSCPTRMCRTASASLPTPGTAPTFTPLAFHQRYVGRFSDDGTTIVGEWQTSADGHDWQRDFGLTYRRT
ncbi:MAG: hypothetical protein ACJ735_03165 [Actinomycetes bacterium]